MMKIGTKVKIRQDSEYYGQSYSIGKICECNNPDLEKDYIYRVIFEDGYSNAYRNIDLIRINNKAKELNI